MPTNEDRLNRMVAEVRAEVRARGPVGREFPHGPCTNCAAGRCPWTARWEAASRLAADAYSAAEWADADGDAGYAAEMRADGDWWTAAAEIIGAGSRARIAAEAAADRHLAASVAACEDGDQAAADRHGRAYEAAVLDAAMGELS